MKSFERRMRDLEYFRTMRLVPGAWTILRLDGRGFTGFTAGRFGKPFDERFRDLMVVTARALLEDFQGIYAHTHSDEISVAFAPDWMLFGRRLEKIVSVSAGLVSATFSTACGEAAHFDSRAWQGVSEEDVVEYFRWRQADAARCALHGWCYWTLRREGMDAHSATRALADKGKGLQNELLYRHGVNFNDLPVWQRRGVGLCWEEYEKPGYDPVRQEAVTTTRRQVKPDLALPMGDAYTAFLRALLTCRRTAR